MAAPTTDATTVDGERVDPGLLAELRRYHVSGVTRDIAWRTGQLSALERMLDEQEEAIVAALDADLGGRASTPGSVTSRPRRGSRSSRARTSRSG